MGKPKLRRPVSLRRRGRRRLWEDPQRPEEEPRARGTPGVQKDPRASTPRDIEACRSPCASPFALVRAKRQSVPQVRQTQGVPRAVFNRLAPHPPRWSFLPCEGETCCMTSHRNEAKGTLRQCSCDGSTCLPAITGPRRADGHAGPGAAWAAGPSHRISDARSCPGHRSPPRVWRR